MSASLVGSEMCIRDSRILHPTHLDAGLQTWAGRLRPGEGVALAVASGGRLYVRGPGEHTK
eukprot:14343382-Alexandrium_andersonii.AAC.1